MALVVSILSSDFDELANVAREQVRFADLLELRLDRWPSVPSDRLTNLISSLGKPVIAACNGPESFGHFRGEARDRFERLRAAARAGASFVDVDWKLARDFVEPLGATKRVVSRHAIDRTPPNLARELEDVRRAAASGDRIKFVAQANSAEDALRVLGLLDGARGELIAFASGAKGSFSRVLAPIFGSPFTYAAPAVIGGRVIGPSAPGQLRADELRAIWPRDGATTKTAIFGVVGRPIGHSLSPRVHTAALRDAEFDAVYVAFEPDDFGAFVELARSPNFRGLSVTAPFKEAAFRAAHSADRRASAARAANTLLRDERGWRAANFDATALEGALRSTKLELAGKRALVVGAGGAARAALVALAELGCRSFVAARELDRARSLAREFGAAALAWAELASLEFDLVIQATPLSARSPIPAEALSSRTIVLEAVYRPLETALVREARARGAIVLDGSQWFLRQAAQQFEAFTARAPNELAMRSAFEDAVGESRATIALVGLRCSGKSSVGRALAASLARPFVDLDDATVALARSEDATIVESGAGELLQRVGLERFREFEARALARVLEGDEPIVLATGGGAVETPANRALLARRARSIWLSVELERLRARLGSDPRVRPSLTGLGALDEIELVARRREPYYREVAELVLECGADSPERLAARIRETISREPGIRPSERDA